MRTTDKEYTEFARRDRDWLQIVASAKIEGIDIDPRDEVLAGRFLKGEITQKQWAEAIHSELGYPAEQGSATEAWLKRTATLTHKMSHDESYRRSIAKRLS
jgi:hypothetical protein